MKKQLMLIVPVMLVQAISNPVQTASASEQQAISPKTLPSPEFSGPMSDLGKSLHAYGIDIGLSFINIYQNAPKFGFSGGSAVNYGAFLFNATANLSQDFQIRYEQAINFPSYNVENYTFDISNAFSPTPVVDSTTDLTRLTLQGNFLADRLEIEAGRMGLNRDFLKRGFCGGIGCINSTSANTLGLPGELLSVWGGRVGYNLASDTILGIGVIEDNPDNWQQNNGWDWGRGRSKGYIGIANITQDESFLSDPRPLNYEVGVYHSSSSYSDALYNSGWGNPTYGLNPTIIDHESGTTGIYGQFRKVLWCCPPGAILPENVAIYGGVFHTFGEGQAYPWEAFAGVEYSGFWAQNPLAGLGFTIHYIGYAKNERSTRLFFSGIDENSRGTHSSPMFTVGSASARRVCLKSAWPIW